MKRKQFQKGMEQIAEEGAIQIFFLPDSGMERVIVGVVGMLQFDVLKFRLQSEYGVGYSRMDLPHDQIRYIEKCPGDPKNLTLSGDTRRVVTCGRTITVSTRTFRPRAVVRQFVVWTTVHTRNLVPSFSVFNSATNI